MGLDYYGLLEINRQATDDDIKKAYRRLALKFHPKRNNDEGDSQRFASIAEAFDVLSCPKTKVLFDQFGEEGLKQGVPIPPGPEEEVGPIEVYTFHGDPIKVFRDFFGLDNPFADYCLPNVDPSYKFFDAPAKPEKGPSIELTFPLTLEEAYYGCVKTMELPVKVMDEDGCQTVDFNRKLTLKVPAGCATQRQFRFRGSGSEGPNILPGDVTFTAYLQPHPVYKLESPNLVIDRVIPLAHALTGCVVDVTTMDGKTIHVPVTDVVSPGYRMALGEEGMPCEGSDKKGDLIIQFDVAFPERFSHYQRELLKQALTKSTQKTDAKLPIEN